MKKIKRWFKKLIRQINGWVYRVKRIIDYVPILWRDWEWDKYGFYRLLGKRCERVANWFDQYALSNDAKNRARELRIAQYLCERIYKDEYLERALGIVYHRWGDFIWPPDDDFVPLMTLTWEKANTPEEQYQADREFREATLRARWSRKRDKEYLFDLLEDRIDIWSE